MEWPDVSIVIPVRNERDAVGLAVASALEQEYPGRLEVVVADGMSTDGTRTLLGELSSDRRLKWVDNPAGSTPAALNTAIIASSGEVIVRCDAHSVLPSGYVRRAVELLEGTGADNVGGIQLARGTSTMHRAIALAMSTPLGVGDAKFHIGGAPGPTDTVYLGVFRRSTLAKVGLFDTTLVRNQDYELNHRIRASGGVVYFHPDLAVEYSPRRSLAALASQYRQYGTWKREVLRRHPDSLRWRQLAAPGLVVGLAASAGLALTPARPLSLVVPGLYLAALAASALLETVRRADPAGLLLPVVLPTMHLAWGFGFLTGRRTEGEPAIARLEP
ncbi:MAG TPA: glycosyltransferase family 2 protein [Acidimicrobiia bacterium]|jgi:glycosyltransferase involved in cell wall biosynthesis